MPLSKTLNYWIAESGSWQSFIDFHLPEDDRAKYSFYPNSDDFYLSLMSRAIGFISKRDNGLDEEEVLSVAKGLEIFSLVEKRDYFRGIDKSNNALFASGLYYLSNYSASAWILASIYPSANYQGVDLFVSNFLRRKLNSELELDVHLSAYLQSANYEILTVLIDLLSARMETAFDEDVHEYFSSILAKALVLKFQEDNIWNDLLSENDDVERWRDYVLRSITKKVPIWNFFPSQKVAIEKGLLRGKTCTLQMPTSSGKTSLCELLVYDEFKTNNECKVLYLAPFRALAAELKHSLAYSLGRLGIRSKAIFGGDLPTIEERNSILDVNLLIATPEKFMAVENIFPGIDKEFTTIICDEGHLLDDKTRGLDYELLLSRLKETTEFNRRFIFISAIIPNVSAINTWLGGSEDTLISSNYRPTELEYAFLRKMRGDGYLLDVNPHKDRPSNYQLYKYLYSDDLTYIDRDSGKEVRITSKKGISVATALRAVQSGTVILFAPHKRGRSGVEDLAREAMLQLTNKPQFSLLEQLPESSREYLIKLTEYFAIVFGTRHLLTQCIQHGILFHHGDFPQNVREIIEDALRKEHVKLAICTNTLAEGVNLPIKTIIIHSTKRYNPNVKGRYESYKIRDLKNLVGRAGRAGKETKGLVIVPHEDDQPLVSNLIYERNVERVRGRLYNIVTFINRYIEERRLVLSPEILDSLGERFQELLDSIDESLIDLLSSEILAEDLQDLVSKLVSRTFSFYQANDEEKETLTKIFAIRADKLLPVVERGDFETLKNSGSSVRLFEEIKGHFDFDNRIWEQEFDPLDEGWLEYILDEGIFRLNKFQYDLESFNNSVKARLTFSDIKDGIKLWMHGSWLEPICEELNLEAFQALGLINSFFGFYLINAVAAVIRIREITYPDSKLSTNILNWTSFLQYGIDTQLELDIIEMGLTDRIVVLALQTHLFAQGYVHSDYRDLREHLIKNIQELTAELTKILPAISAEKMKYFFERLDIRNVL